jgi:hypothetical protein
MTLERMLNSNADRGRHGHERFRREDEPARGWTSVSIRAILPVLREHAFGTPFVSPGRSFSLFAD